MRLQARPSSRRKALAAGAAFAALLAASQAGALPASTGAPAQVNSGGGQPSVATDNSSFVTVTLNAQRTIMDWSSYNVASHETVTYVFGANNGIVLNRITGSAQVDGTLKGVLASGGSGGNVWLYSPQGVAFGSTAVVDVGGLLATSAAPNVTEFLNTQNLDFHFTGSGSGGPVTLAGGSQFNGRGYLAFVAPRVSSGAGANVTAGDYGTAAYGAMDTYEIKFIPAFNNDLTFFTFLVPNGASGTPYDTPLNLAGTTTGANVYLMAISRAQLTSVLINAPGLLVGQSSFNNYGQVTITTGRNITNGQVNETSTPVPGARSGNVQLGEINAAGNVNVAVTGRFGTSNLTADRIRAGQGLLIVAHDITIGSGGLVAGDSNVNLGEMVIDTNGTVNIGAVTARTGVRFQTGDLQAGGSFDLPFLHLGTVTLGGDFNSVAETLNVDAITATNVLSSTEDFTVAGSLVGSADVRVAASTSLSLGSVRAGALTRLTFQDFTLSGTVRAADAVIRVLTPDQALVGGSGAGRRVSNATLQKFTVSNSLTLQAGIDGDFPVSNDLIVDDIDLDPAKVPELRLLAKTTNNVEVRGSLIPSGAGVVLKIGDPVAVDSIWKPKQILVTGALGSAKGDALAGFTDVKAFGRVEMVATNDILIGSQRFLDLVQPVPAEQIDIGLGMPQGVAAEGDEIGKLFLVSGSLAASAGDRIVQQNTGAPGLQSGFFLTGQGVAADKPLLTVGGAKIADLSGALQTAEGVVSAGQQASHSSRIARLEGDTSTGSIRINGCVLPIGCSVSTPANEFRIESFRPAATRSAVDPPILTPPPAVDDDERAPEVVVTGAGNEEIWRRDK